MTARVREWLLWCVLLGVVTAAMLAVRTRLNQAHVALAYLLIVQGGSARGGRPLGFALAGAAFIGFDLLFLPPYGTLVIQDPLNWLVLAAFLGTSVLSAQLLYRAQEQATVARERAAEIDRLASLGAETINAGRAEEALAAIVGVIRSSLALDDCAVFAAIPAPVDELATWVVEQAKNAVVHVDGTTSVGASDSALSDGTARAYLRLLRVRGTPVGVLRIERGSGLRLTPAQTRVLDALSYYAALGVERVRLVAEAERVTALQEAHRAKDAVLASVSHDLRTPLTTIKGIAHEISVSGDDRASIIEEEADRLNVFVAQLLDLSRVASGAAAPDIQVNEAEDLLGAAAQRVAGRLGDHALRIHVSGADALHFGRFDFAQTLRALVNVVENAAKYSPAGEPIDLSVARRGDTLCFSVEDRGPGVPADERSRVFEPFYRLRPALGGGAEIAPADVAGAGLGLAIAKGIAEAQGGALVVEDRAGGGASFTLSVPAVTADGFS